MLLSRAHKLKFHGTIKIPIAALSTSNLNLQVQVNRDKETIVQLLYNIGSKKEVEQYLRQFSAVDSKKFAVIKVGGAVLTEQLEQLVSSLTFLNRVGLYPIVVHGAGPQLNTLLEQAGVTPHYRDGMRVTDPKTLAVARQCFMQENLKLVEALEAHGTRARPVVGGVFEAEFLDRDRYGLVGKVTRVHRYPIESSIRAGALPIVTSLAESVDGQILNVNADAAAGELARALEPLKTIFLNSSGGMAHPVTDEKMSVVNLDEDYEHLIAEFAKKGTMLKLMEIKSLLDDLPRSSSVAITNAQHLSKELFTDSGAGTLIRRGHRLFRSDSLNDIDTDKMRLLFQDNDNVMKRQNSSVASYLHDLSQTDDVAIFGDEAYEIIAVVKGDTKSKIIPVLDRFVSTRMAELNNVNESVWQQVVGAFPKLIWTVANDDPSRSWFFEKSDGSIVQGESTLFWHGLSNVNEVKDAVTEFTSSGSRQSHIQGGPFLAGQKRSYSTTVKRIGLIGARGHTGKELIQLIDNHPGLDLAYLSSRELEGQEIQLTKKNQTVKFTNLTPEHTAQKRDVDCWVLALPNNICKPWVSALSALTSPPLMVDLSADYRFDSQWTYGLPELYNSRAEISKSKRISNPGCYATGMQMALYPLVRENLLDNFISPTVMGVSGYSGAGTKPSMKNDVAVLKANLLPYALTGHIHEREVSYHLNKMNSQFNGVYFSPHVASFFRGISLTTNVVLKETISQRELFELYATTYANDKLVEVTTLNGGPGGDGIPYVKDVQNKPFVEVGGFRLGEVSLADKSMRRLVLISTIDNLAKGASTQAMQNINLALGFDEYAGILI